MEVLPLASGWGAEIRGLDLSRPLGSDQGEILRRTFDERSLLVFRNDQVTPEQHIALSRLFGDLDCHESLPHLRHPDYPEILLVTNLDEQGVPSPKRVVGQQWHSDLSCTPRPALGSLLNARVLPESGGDTLFANMHLAYEALSAPMQRFLSGLTAVHDVLHARHQRNRPRELLEDIAQRNPPIAHPVVRMHPATGRGALYVNEMLTTRIRELSEKESDGFLSFLFQHVTRPEYVYRHRWHAGDIVMWDNRALQHYAVADYSGLRKMYRTTLLGEPCGTVLDRPDRESVAAHA